MSFSIETIKEYGGRGFKCALFDFDGTISLIREGWQKVMIPYFCEVIEALGTNENKDAICDEVTEFVDRLTGKQTIFQCIALDEAVVRRGGACGGRCAACRGCGRPAPSRRPGRCACP